MGKLQQRARRDADRVVSTAVAAAMLDKVRQTIDSGLRAGTIEGFRDPETRRLWVELDWVEARRPGNRQILRRLAALEAATKLGEPHNAKAPVAETPLGETKAGAGVDEPPAEQPASTQVLAENVTLRTVSLQLLAVADAYADHAEHSGRAERLEDKARKQRRKASSALRRANASYREAVSQMLLPGSPEDLDR